MKRHLITLIDIQGAIVSIQDIHKVILRSNPLRPPDGEAILARRRGDVSWVIWLYDDFAPSSIALDPREWTRQLVLPSYDVRFGNFPQIVGSF